MISTIILILSSITAIIGMVSFKRLTIPFKILSWYLLFAFLDNIVDQYVNAVFKNNLWVLHMETIANYIFFSLIYYYFLKNELIRKLILLSLLFVIVFFIINALYLEPYNKVFPSNTMLVNEILFVIFSLILFKQMLLYPVQVNITKQGVFWYNTAILFFSATMFFNFSLINYYYHHNVQTPVLSYFWHGIDITFNLLLGIAVLTENNNVILADAKR
jgi:hypothetical protein